MRLKGARDSIGTGRMSGGVPSVPVSFFFLGQV